MLILAPALTGCVPALDGVVGLGVDEAGQPIGLVRSCETRMPWADLTVLDDPTVAPINARLAEWEFTADTRRATVTWSLLGGSGPDVVVVAMATDLPSGMKLALGAGGVSRAGGSVEFETGILDRLRPGQILIADEEGLVNTVVGRAEFDGLACERSTR